jgi:hypothetical protein
VNALARQSQRLLQIGVGLLLFASFEGFVIPYFAAPRLGLSAHTLSALQSVLLLVLGLAWTRLNLGDLALRVAFWLLVYSTFAYACQAGQGGRSETGARSGRSVRMTISRRWNRKVVSDRTTLEGLTQFA